MRGARRQSREDAIQILYQLDLNAQLQPALALQYFEDHYTAEGKKVDEFCKRLVLGVMDNLQEIDALIKKYSEHWRLDRMPSVDKNILRLGAYELKFCDDIPATVTLNEMIEIGKQFGSENTPPFVNGLLDKIRVEVVTPAKAK